MSPTPGSYGAPTYRFGTITALGTVTVFPGTANEREEPLVSGAVTTQWLELLDTGRTGPLGIDVAAASAFYTDWWDTPSEIIYLDFDGSWIESVLENVGPGPDFFEDWNQGVVVNGMAPDHTGNGLSWYYTKFPATTTGVIYRQVDYDAT